MGQKLRRFDVPADVASPLDVAVTRRDGSVLNMVTEAIRTKNTMLAYQPVVTSIDQTRVGFYEGLIRVLDETGRVIPAKDFMPVVEDSELGRELDVLSLRMGLIALSQVPELRLSINMSARSIGFQKWNQTLKRGLDQHPSIGERLILEITESSAMMVPELVVDFMDRWSVRGICFALDDFGAGHTALRYFKDFYFDMMKIDGQFITGIASDPDNQALVKSMVGIAQHFDMLTVAEFVENESDAAALAALGVDCLQGYLYGAPALKPSWLIEGRKRARAG